MRYEDLSQEDQELVNMDFGDLEKEAQEKLAEANEVYAYGQEQAHLVADQMDEAMAKFASDDNDEDDDEEEELDEESEKKAAELGAFIERGMFDELTKLGSERHGDAMYYYYPYMEEKVAQIGAEEKLAGWKEEVGKKITQAGNWVKGQAGKGWDATKAYHKKGRDQVKGGVEKMRLGAGERAYAKKRGIKPDAGAGKMFREGALDTAKGSARFLPHAAVVGGAGYGAKKIYDK